MLPKNIQTLIIILVFVIFAIIGSSYLSSKLNPSSNNPTKQSDRRVFPKEITSQIDANLKITHQQPGDTSGRTVLYTVDNTSSYHNWGVGEVFDLTTKEKRLARVIGIFSGWENIVGTLDKYMVLEDPKSGSGYTKLHVAFEQSPTLNGKENATYLAFENLSTGKIEITKKLVMDINQSLLPSLIKRGDAITVYTAFNIDEQLNNLPLVDENGLPYAGLVILRRNQGISQIESEYGKIF